MQIQSINFIILISVNISTYTKAVTAVTVSQYLITAMTSHDLC